MKKDKSKLKDKLKEKKEENVKNDEESTSKKISINQKNTTESKENVIILKYIFDVL